MSFSCNIKAPLVSGAGVSVFEPEVGPVVVSGAMLPILERDH